MPAEKLKDLDKLCIHTITTKPWGIEEAVDNYAAAGVSGVTVWRQWLEGHGANKVGEMIRGAGMDVVSVARGGFFPAATQAERDAAIEENKRAIDECAGLGAPVLVLVCGAHPDNSVQKNIDQIQAGIEALIPHAESCGVKLGIEPLHPMYADERSAINTVRTANDVCERVGSPFIGVTVDVYHVWWDDTLEQEIKRAAVMGRLFSFHVCDWKFPLEDMLNDRGLMGEGCIDIRTIRGWVEDAGFNGYNEVEIFSNRWWATDQHEFLKKIVDSYIEHV